MRGSFFRTLSGTLSRNRIALSFVWIALCAPDPDAWAQTSETDEVRASVRVAASTDWGPIYSADQTPGGAHRHRAMGPLYESQSSTGVLRFDALRPFWSCVEDFPNERSLSEFLWPVATVRDLGNDRSWRLLIAYGHDFDTTAATRYRTVVFPVYHMGRTAEDQSYVGIFPIWGDIREVLTYDRARFVLFPLFLELWKKDVHSVSWLWPIFSRARGEDYSATRVFPLYGSAHDEKGSNRRFVLWPIWTQRWNDDPEVDERGFILFPIYGEAHNPGGETHWVLPPFFKFQHAGEQRQILAPWPFVQYSRGHVNKFYLWPLWGQKDAGTVESQFFLWPIVRFQDVQRHDSEFRQRFILPFIYYQDIIATSTHEREMSYFKLWPLFSYQRENETSRLRALELWPLKKTGSIDRNFAPFWTLFSHHVSGGIGKRNYCGDYFASARARMANAMCRYSLFITGVRIRKGLVSGHY